MLGLVGPRVLDRGCANLDDFAAQHKPHGVDGMAAKVKDYPAPRSAPEEPPLVWAGREPQCMLSSRGEGLSDRTIEDRPAHGPESLPVAKMKIDREDDPGPFGRYDQGLGVGEVQC